MKLLLSLLFSLVAMTPGRPVAEASEPVTAVSIDSDKFCINGVPTFRGRSWQELPLEGLLPNARLVQGVFDDLNPETVARWNYPDTGKWDPERNTREFIEAMPLWRQHGLLAFTINFQGGSPEGYSRHQPWENNGFDAQGNLRPDYAARMERIIREADRLGMVVILGYFYFGQDQRLENEQAVLHATDNATQWVLDQGFQNVIIEVANECNNRAYDHDIIGEKRVHELITRVQQPQKEGRRLLVSVSFNGNTLPPDQVVKVSDFVLLHGNGVNRPARIREMVQLVRDLPSFQPKPIVFNEDDHFDFDQPENNFLAATRAYASWGYFDFRMQGEGFDDGYQSVPVNWRISSARKQSFFSTLKRVFLD